MEAKRELVYEIAEWSQGAPELLESWTRQDILQLLCTETGKDKKYTGVSKLKLIDILLKIVADKKKSKKTLEGLENATKRQRKSDQPDIVINIVDSDTSSDEMKVCKNSACRAKLYQEDEFCKRCSCCICHKYDDNKDPSLWLTCSSEPPYQEKSCGYSCHLECALQHEKSGIPKDEHSRGLDGSFYCISCGKVNDLLQCWRKQMTIARDTRRVDILCYRASLSQKLLSGTVRHENLHKIVKEIIEILKADVGPLTGLPVRQARGIINRLASGQEVQRLCKVAVECLDSVLSHTHDPVVKDNEKLKRSQSLATNSSSLSNPSSVEDENNNIAGYKDPKEKQSNNCNETENIAPDDKDDTIEIGKKTDQFAHMTEVELPISPCKAESSKDGKIARKLRPEPSKNNLDDGSGKEQDGSSSKKRSGEEEQDRDFEYYVKVIRSLECNQHIDTSFRQKFLTWYSLRASPQEVRIVKVFVDTFMDDPALLAEQLVDTFSEVITSKKCSNRLCLKLFH